MTAVDVEQRVAILLTAFGDEMTEAVLTQLSAEGESRLRERIRSLAEVPPEEEHLVEVVDEFDRVLSFALEAIDDEWQDPDRSAVDTVGRHDDALEKASFVASDDAVSDLHKLKGFQIAGGLKGETPRVIAVVLDCLEPELASDTMRYLPDDIRSGVISQLNVLQPMPPVLLTRIIRTVIEKGLETKRDSLSTEDIRKEQKLAELLRNMDKKERNKILAALEEENGELVERIRDLLYKFEDILVIEDRSLQKLLGEIETKSLCTALFEGDAEILNKITSNLSKRARESLLEEMDLMSNVSDDDREAAQKEVTQAIQRLDQAGELVMH